MHLGQCVKGPYCRPICRLITFSRLDIWWCSQLIFIPEIIKIDRQIVKEIDMGRFWRNPCAGFLNILPISSLRRIHSPQSKENYAVLLPKESCKDSECGWVLLIIYA